MTDWRDIPMRMIALAEALADPLGKGVTLVDGLLVARYLGESTELARRLFTEMWKLLRPVLMKRAPCVPRIWNT